MVLPPDDDQVRAAGGAGLGLETAVGCGLDAGLGDRTQDLGLQRSWAASVPARGRTRRVAAGASRTVTATTVASRRAASRRAQTSPVVRARRPVHLDEQPGGLPAGEQRREAERLGAAPAVPRCGRRRDTGRGPVSGAGSGSRGTGCRS